MARYRARREKTLSIDSNQGPFPDPTLSFFYFSSIVISSWGSIKIHIPGVLFKLWDMNITYPIVTSIKSNGNSDFMEINYGTFLEYFWIFSNNISFLTPAPYILYIYPLIYSTEYSELVIICSFFIRLY